MPEPTEIKPGEEVNEDGKKGEELSNKFDVMLENIQNLKDSGDATNTKVESLLDEALKEGGKKVEENYSEEDLQQMTPTQVVELITKSVSDSLGGRMEKLETAIMTIQITGEIKELKGEFEDFDSLKKEVHQKVISVPNLSVRDAYKLVKADRGETITKKETKPNKEKENKGNEDVKKTLIKTFFGEKPNIAPGATKDKGPGTIREAASKAFDDLNTE